MTFSTMQWLILGRSSVKGGSPGSQKCFGQKMLTVTPIVERLHIILLADACYRVVV